MLPCKSYPCSMHFQTIKAFSETLETPINTAKSKSANTMTYEQNYFHN